MDKEHLRQSLPSPSSLSSSNWSHLHDDILSLILTRLSRMEVFRLSSVCSSWRRVIKQYIPPSSDAVPWLILPPNSEDKEEDVDGCRFYSVGNKKFYKQKKSICKDFGKRHCIGSSHGWLILLDRGNVNELYLLNPFSGIRISLPSFKDDANLCLEKLGDYSNFFYKAILSWSPLDQRKKNINNKNINEYVVTLIYSNQSKLGYWKHGDIAWKKLDGICACQERGYYSDLIWYKDCVYALSTCKTSNGIWSATIEVWDFKKNSEDPVKLMELKAPLPSDWKIDTRPESPLDTRPESRLFTKFYLVESCGDILVVARNITKDHPIWRIQAYNTYDFRVCKMDFKNKLWIKLENLDPLGDRVLFLGGNHSLSLSAQDFPELRKASVYYTDDWWRRIFICGQYGGHDMGIIWSRGRKSIFEEYPKPIIREYRWTKIQPPPFWVLPNPWW